MRRPGKREFRQFDEEDLEGPDGFVLAGWGMAATLCVVAAIGTWQYIGTGYTRFIDLASLFSDPIEITGSIGKPSDKRQPMPEIAIVSPVESQDHLTVEIGVLRKEIIALRRNSQKLQKQNDGLTRRLAKIEESFGDITGSIAPDHRPKQSPIRMSTIGNDQPLVVKKMPLDTGAITKYSDAPLPKVTKSMVDDPPMTAAPKSLFALDLGEHSTKQDVKRAWTMLSARHQDALKGVVPLIRASTSDGPPVYRLVAGPFDNAAEAADVCAVIKVAGSKCSPTLHLGRKLAMQ